MKNIILRVFFIIMAVILILEIFYFFNLAKVQKIQNAALRQYQGIPVYTARIGYSPVFGHMRDRDFFAEMDAMRKKMNKMLRESFSEPLEAKSTGLAQESIFFKPRMDFEQTGVAYILYIDIPGVNKNEINIQIEDGYMTVSGERKTETKQEKQGFYRQELTFGKFFRTIVLPEDAIAKEVTSEYADGVLTIKVPRKSRTKVAGAALIKVPVK